MVLKWALARDHSALPVRPLLRWCAIATPTAAVRHRMQPLRHPIVP